MAQPNPNARPRQDRQRILDAWLSQPTMQAEIRQIEDRIRRGESFDTTLPPDEIAALYRATFGSR
jgi:hypothetical protein